MRHRAGFVLALALCATAALAARPAQDSAGAQLAPKGSTASKVVRAAYDDGLEQVEGDEESSARTHGLADTLVRPALGNKSSKEFEKGRAAETSRPGSVVVRAANYIGAASLEVLKALSTRLDIDIGARKQSSVGEDKPIQEFQAEHQPVPVPASSGRTAQQRDFIQIGDERVDSSRVNDIGDLDGNGFRDYAVRSPLEGEKTGAVRIYLMDAGNAIARQRHIVPGKWGFATRPLRKGDMFGSSALAIGDVNDDGVEDIAIGAPGDSESGASMGAVYVLLMKRDGTVLDNQKVSAATDASLRRQHTVNEGFGTTLRSLADINGDKVRELAVGSSDGTTTLVFVSSTGHAHAGIKFAPRGGPASSADAAKHVLMRTKSLLRMTVSDAPADVTVRSRSARAAGECYFSDTHCQCKSANVATSKCLSVVETLDNGRTTCEERGCNASYRCSCDGTEFCKYGTAQRSIQRAEEGAGKDRVYCHTEVVTAEKVQVLPGAAIPSQGPLHASAAGGWNATHCACASKAAAAPREAGTCVQFDHTSGGKSYCSTRPCRPAAASDMTCSFDGASICTRTEATKSVYVDDGAAGPTLSLCHQAQRASEAVSCVSNCP
jgi:hypothetical protein